MRTQSYHAEVLVELFKNRKIAKLPELRRALGTTADMTVFRKLREIGYRTSYSHRGKYYALEEDMDFDAHGLWAFDSVRFSKHGTLLDTACAFVAEADAGFFGGLSAYLASRCLDAICIVQRTRPSADVRSWRGGCLKANAAWRAARRFPMNSRWPSFCL